jgi:carboxyl-terminal processing protease
MRPHRFRFALLIGLVTGMADTASAETLPLEDRVLILSKTYQAVSLYFAHWDGAAYGPGDVDSVYEQFLKRVIDTEDRERFTVLMREYLALLNNGHCWYTDFVEHETKPRVGFDWRYIDREWVVIQSSIPKISVGDVVDSLNGQSPENLYRELSTRICASSDRARRTAFLTWALKGFLPESYTIVVRDRGGENRRVSVHRPSLTEEPDTPKTTGYWLQEPTIAYIKIPSFGSPEFEEDALSLVHEYRMADGLIIDVRGNGGGNTPSKLTETLMDRPYRWYTESTPLSVGLFHYYAESSGPWWEKFRRTQLLWSSDYETPDRAAYTGRVILLVDRRTGSAAEDFVMPFKDNRRASIIGETTMGSTGQPYLHRFDDIGSIGIGTKRAYLPDGSRFEGVGIAPDIVVTTTRKDLYDGADPVLQRARAEAVQ